MAWIDEHIEWVGGLVVTLTLTVLGGMGTVLAFIGKAVYKDRRGVLQSVTEVEEITRKHASMFVEQKKDIADLRNTLEHEVQTARDERHQIRYALDEHSNQVREDFKRVHERTDDVFQLLTDLPTKIISVQRDSR